MPLKTGTIDEPHLNLTPLIDVVFLLIIFFLVGSEFTRRKAEAEVKYNIELPSVAGVVPLTDLPDPITVNVTREGGMYVFGGPQNARNVKVNLRQLEAFLHDAKKLDNARKFRGRVVVIRGSGPGPYQHVIDVLTVCKQANYRTVSLAAKPEADNVE